MLNVNEAHAYASCSNCVAVAVAFQVVLVMEDAHVVVPQNLAVAANYDCYQCITAAIASQLVLTVEEQPGEEQLLALGAVWNQLLEFAATITSYSVTEIMEQLETVQSEIVAILAAAPAGDISPSTTVPASRRLVIHGPARVLVSDTRFDAEPAVAHRTAHRGLPDAELHRSFDVALADRLPDRTECVTESVTE